MKWFVMHATRLFVATLATFPFSIQALGQVFNNTGSDTCAGAVVVDVPVGPVGNPLTVTITGDNSGATLPDCTPPVGHHVGPVWWEAFRITERARVTVDLCATTPVQEPSYNLIYGSCSIPSSSCAGVELPESSGRGAPFCGDGNQWSTYSNLNPRTYRVPILSDPGALIHGLGPYVMHIHASACPGSCCNTAALTCTDCADPAACTGPNDVFHAALSCDELNCECPGSCCHTTQATCDDCVAPATCTAPGDEFHPAEYCFQSGCLPPPLGPDVIVGRVGSCIHFGRVGPVGSGTVAVTCDTMSCNKGTSPANWFRLPAIDHPVISLNLFRLETVDGSERFEQIGQSWLKHGYGSENLDDCGLGCQGGIFEQLSPNCSDTYIAMSFAQCTLGPRSMIHPYRGTMPAGGSLGTIPDCGPFSSTNESFPSNDHRDHIHTPISHKLQIPESDLNPVLHPGARYFAEGQYLVPHEFIDGNGNQNNNTSHAELRISGPSVTGEYVYIDESDTAIESPALDAWPGASQSMIEPSPLADGRAFLAGEVTDLGGGQWHYEYAIYNMNLDASVGSFCVPLAPGATITNVGFHAPLHHAPEPHADNYSNAPWTPTITSGAIRWDTDSFAANPLANAVRFGTLYNFRFDADLPPQSVSGLAGLFKSAAVAVPVALPAPTLESPEDRNLNGIPDACELFIPDNPQADLTGPSKTRFVSFTIPKSNAAGTILTAMRMKLVSLHHVAPPYTGGPSIPFTSFEGEVRWVGPPVQFVESVSNQIPFYASQLQCDPHYQDWSTVGLLHVTGSAITPSSVYEVENVAASCMGAEDGCAAVSAPLEIGTTRWGDVETPYNPPSLTVQPDLADVSALVNKFRNSPGAPIKARALLVGGDAFGVIDIATEFSFIHIAGCVDAFRGRPYPHTIDACP